MTDTVVCVYWRGDFRGRNYSADWVARLRNMVGRHLPAHRFICMSNDDVPGIETLPLIGDLQGWWSKLELFRPDNGLTGRCLYLDLGTLVVDDLAPVMGFDAPIALMPSSHVLRGGTPAGGDGIVDQYQSSCMVWDAGQGAAIWDRFTARAMARFRGDQDWIGHILPGLPTLPPEWFCKLRHCTDGPPDKARVVLSMPWKNDIAAKRFQWVRETWR